MADKKYKENGIHALVAIVVALRPVMSIASEMDFVKAHVIALLDKIVQSLVESYIFLSLMN